jgi:hypothetical protein
VKPPSQIGGRGFWIGSGVTLTFWKSKKSLLKVMVSPARARRMMSSDWLVRAPRSFEQEHARCDADPVGAGGDRRGDGQS